MANPKSNPPYGGQNPKWIAMLVAVCALTFADVLKNDFLWDDEQTIVANPRIRSLRSAVRLFAPTSWWQMTEGMAYRPITYLSLALDHAFWGLGPSGYHWTNLCLHAANSLLVFALAQVVLARSLPAFLATLLFAVHPVQVESLSLVENRSELLACLFTLVSFLAFCVAKSVVPTSVSFMQECRLQPAERGKTGQPKGCTPEGPCHWSVVLWSRGLVVSLACFLAAMLSKETAIVLPALLAACALVLTPPENRRAALTRTWPFWAAAILYAVIRLAAMREPGVSAASTGGALRVAIAAKTLLSYLGLLLLPHPLAIEYRFSFPSSWSSPEALLCILVVTGGLALLVVYARRLPAAAFSAAWLLLALLPAANLVVVGPRMLADQRLYLPSVGYSLGFGLLLAAVVRSPARLWLLGVFALLAALTIQRDAVWKNGLSFWRDAVSKSPQNAAHRVNLAQTLGRIGQAERAERGVRRAVQMNPQLARPYAHLAEICLERGDVDTAATHFRQAVERAASADPFTRGQAHAGLARIHVIEGRARDALTEYDLALKSDPYLASARAGRGLILEREGRDREAVGEYEMAVQLDPDLKGIRRQLGLAHERAGRPAEALREYELALGMGREEDARTRSAMGDIHRRSGALEQAAAEYELALLADPCYAPAHLNLGNVHMSWQQPERAVRDYRRAIEMDPTLAQAHFNLGLALRSLNRTAEAAAAFEKCLEIAPEFAPAREQLLKLKTGRNDE